MTEYFIAALINLALMNITPHQGWVQSIVSFETKIECEAAIPDATSTIFLSIYQWTHGLGQIEDIRCMNEEEWIKANEELGHVRPLWVNPPEEEPVEKKDTM
jgi:hypothetical protein